MDYTSLTCCSLAFVLYYNTLEAGFVYDDRRAILSNPDLLPTTSWKQLFQNDFWGTPLSDSGSHGSYRPLCVLSFRFNYILNGFQPWGYHFVNVILHCLATALLIRVARTILPKTKSSIGPLITGLAFASHPIHTEAVAGIVGRADLAACNLYLLSFLIYMAHVKYRKLSCNKTHCKFVLLDRENQYNNNNNNNNNNNINNSKQDDPLKQIHKFNNKIVTNFKTNLTNCSWPNGVRKEQCGLLMSGQKTRRINDTTNNLNNNNNINNNNNSNNNMCCWLLRLKEWGCLFVCILFAVAAMLSKETGVTVLGVCILYDFLISSTNHRRHWRSILVLVIAATLMLIFRLQTRPPQFSTADNPTAKESKLLTRFLSFIYLPVLNFCLLLYPNVLSFDWGMDVIPRITTIQDPRNLLTVVFYLTLCLTIRQCINGIPIVYRRTTNNIEEKIKYCPCPVCRHNISEMHSASCRSSNNNNSMNLHSCLCLKLPKHVTFRHRTRKYNSIASLLALGFLTIPFLPATNLFFYVGFVIAERVLYIPSVGLCLMIGLGASKLWSFKRHRSVTSVGLFVLIVAFGGRTVIRNRDWLNEESLYRSAIPVNSPKAFGNLGSVLSNQGRIVEAEWAFRQALLHRPNMADVHYNLGVLLQGKQQLNEAILSFQRAIHFRPSLALAYVNLGAALIAAGRCQEAVSVLRQGSRLDGTGLRDRREHETARVSALLQLGALYSDQGRLQRALAAYREAAHSLPEHYPPQSVFNVLGETLARLHQDEEAERWYQAALNAQPDHVPAHITYGKLLAKNISRIAEAEQWFRRAQRLAPDDPSVYHHYGEFLASRRRHKEAAVLYEKSAELRPNDYELAVAAATAMRQAGRYHDAERWYRKAVTIKPMDARGHTNLGAILHLNGKYREAADSYREALRLQPNDVTTLTNLHKLHSVMT